MRWQGKRKKIIGLEERKRSHPSCCGSSIVLCSHVCVIQDLSYCCPEHQNTTLQNRERERSDVHLNAFNSFYIHTDITQSIIHEWPYVYSTQHLHIVVGLIASIVLICKSLQKKTSAKWSNINVNAY